MNIEDVKNTIIQGDVLDVLKKIPDESIDLIITSPPYYSLRNYGVEGQIGLEETFEEYLEKILKITAELKRVLKKTGQFWLNIGDCYGGLPAGNKSISEANIGTDGLYVRKMKQSYGAKSFVKGFDKKNYGGLGQKRINTMRQGRGRRGNQASKCLLMQPERLAIAMIDRQGWILRNKVKWAKQVLIKKENKTIGSVMPTSVKDRFNESGEEFYFFVKNKRYYSNLDAVRIPNQVLGVTEHRPDGFTRSRELQYDSKYLQDYAPFNKQSGQRFNLRARDTKRKAGQPGYKVTKEEIKRYKKESGKIYGSPRARAERRYDITKRQNELKNGGVVSSAKRIRGFFDEYGGKTNPLGKNIPTIWQINPEPHNFRHELGVDIDHFAIFPQTLVEIPIKFGCPPDGIVLDPFSGAGTTLVVAKRLGKNYLGIELNSKYIKLANARLKAIQKPLI